MRELSKSRLPVKFEQKVQIPRCSNMIKKVNLQKMWRQISRQILNIESTQKLIPKQSGKQFKVSCAILTGILSTSLIMRTAAGITISQADSKYTVEDLESETDFRRVKVQLMPERNKNLSREIIKQRNGIQTKRNVQKIGGTLLQRIWISEGLNIDGDSDKSPVGITLRNVDAVNSLAFSPDGQILASAGEDFMIRLWDKQGNQQTPYHFCFNRYPSIDSIAFSPDGQTIAAVGFYGFSLWDLQGEHRSAKNDLSLEDISSFSSVAFSPDGEIIVAAGSSDMRLFDRQGNILKSINHGSIRSIAFSPDGQTIASTVGIISRMTVKLLDRQGKQLISFGNDNNLRSVEFSPDGQIIATVSGKETIKIWNLQGKQLALFKGSGGFIDSVRFSPNGETLVSANDDGTIQIWNRQGKQLALFEGHDERISSLVFSPDGKTIASASDDGSIKIWNQQGKNLASFRHQQSESCSTPPSYRLPSLDELRQK